MWRCCSKEELVLLFQGQVSAAVDLGVVFLAAPAKVGHGLGNNYEGTQLRPQLAEGGFGDLSVTIRCGMLGIETVDTALGACRRKQSDVLSLEARHSPWQADSMVLGVVVEEPDHPRCVIKRKGLGVVLPASCLSLGHCQSLRLVVLVQAGQQVLTYAKQKEEDILADRSHQPAVTGTRPLAIMLQFPFAALGLRAIPHACAQDTENHHLLCIYNTQ